METRASRPLAGRTKAVAAEAPAVSPLGAVGGGLIGLATRDPEGARRAILDYGKLIDWPDLRFGRLDLKGGEKGWTKATAEIVPLWLGVAWQGIEQRESARAAQTAKIRTQAKTRKDKEEMATLTWNEGTMLEPGAYSAIVESITETEGEYGPQLQFQFVVLDAEGQETDDEIRGWCSAKWGPKTKLCEWAKAMLGKRCPGPGQPIDTDKLLKRRCDLLVGEKPGKNGQTRTGIEAIYPYQTVSRQADDSEEEDKPF